MPTVAERQRIHNLVQPVGSPGWNETHQKN